MIQGGEGGGDPAACPTTLLLPTVLDAVDIPVIAAGGFFDGRGLAAALSYGAAGVGMGTPFLLTRDSAVPDAVKQLYPSHGLDGAVHRQVDGMADRIRRADLVEQLQESWSSDGWVRPSEDAEFKQQSGLSWLGCSRNRRTARRRAPGRSLAQTALAADTRRC